MTINDLIKFAVENHASDLHISGNEPPQIRIAGVLRHLAVPPLSEEEVSEMILNTLTDDLKKKFAEDWDVDYSYNLDGVARCRANAFIGTRGPCAAFRLIGSKVIPWDKMGLPDNVRELAFKEKGLILITGPAGCGKSTTMTSFIDIINKNRAAHILTLEDPVEFIHEPNKSLITHRQIGDNTKSFASALKGALREDPDVILVGEMRDKETIQLALTAAETGHLVVSTLHTDNAPKTINRIINTFSMKDQGQIRTMISEGLLAVISQALVPRKDGKGVIPAFEVLIGTSTVRSMIRADKLHEIPNAIETGMKYNMKNLQKALSDLIQEGKCWKKDCMRFAEMPDLLPDDVEFIYDESKGGAYMPGQEGEEDTEVLNESQADGSVSGQTENTEEQIQEEGPKSIAEQMYEEHNSEEQQMGDSPETPNTEIPNSTINPVS